MKRGLIVLALCCILAVGAQALTNVSSCQTLSSSDTYSLTANVSSAGTCFTVTASDVLIDCQGFTITYNTGGGGTTQGVVATDVSGVSVRNCAIVDPTTSGTVSYGVNFVNVSNGTIDNNTLRLNGTSTTYGVRLASGTVGINVTDNDVSVQSSADGTLGVFFIVASNNRVSGNTLRTRGGTSAITNYGMYLSVSSWYNIIENNYMSATSVGSDYANGFVAWNNISHNVVRNNTMTNFGDPSTNADGIQLSGGPATFDFNNITDNTVIVNTSTAPTKRGISLAVGVGNLVARNTITTIGSSGNTGIDIFIGNDTTVVNNSVSIGSTTAYGIRLRSGSVNVSLTGNALQNMFGWMTIQDTSNATLTDNKFNSTNSTIELTGASLLSGPTNVTQNEINASFNNAFVNSSAIPQFNTTARITFTNTGFLGHQILVDFEDNGTFIDCNPPDCVEVSDTPNRIVFDVLHFTTFSTEEFIPPVPEFSTIALFTILGLVLGGFVILRRQ